MNDREKIEKIIADRKSAHPYLSAESKVYREFLGMERARLRMERWTGA